MPVLEIVRVIPPLREDVEKVTFPVPKMVCEAVKVAEPKLPMSSVPIIFRALALAEEKVKVDDVRLVRDPPASIERVPLKTKLPPSTPSV